MYEDQYGELYMWISGLKGLTRKFGTFGLRGP